MAEIVSMELITPSDPAPLHSKLLKSSLLDQFSPPFYTPLVFFYHNQNPNPNPQHSDPSEKTRHLKQALSVALAKFYPLAGRLNRPGDLSVDCDDSGALFVEARFPATFSQALKNATLPEINQFLPFHPHKMDEKLFGTYSRNEILFAAKVCWFDCGSSAIGVCQLHAVADVMCLASFVTSWAGVSKSTEAIVPDPDFESGARLFPALDLPDSDQPAAAVTAAKKKNVFRRLLFGKEKIAELKLLAAGSSPIPTRVEVVTSFIWKHFINLERAKKEGAAETMFIARHPVNVRSRMSSLASSKRLVYGNVAVVTSASFMLSGKEDEELAYRDLVRLTGAGLKKVDEDFVINNVLSDPVSYVKSMTASGVEQEGVMVHECYFTSWNRFPMYEMDFGWGRPVLVTPAGSPASSDVAVLMGTPFGDGIEAWVGIKEDDIPFLSHEFTALATTRIFPDN